MQISIKNRLINSANAFVQTIYNHILHYPSPINFTYAYSFGSLVGLFFGIQLFTGFFLAMHYVAYTNLAFDAMVHIMTDVKNGYLMRYMHANGASMIFIFLYLHIGRGLYYRSYIHERKWLWWSGIVIFLLMMATAFIGYVLPWGQMSFWGATVITSLVTAVPFVGESIAHWIWGGFSVSNATLIRFFSLHYLLPFIVTAIILVHLILLHIATSTNPLQTESIGKIPFHPYYTIKDLFAFSVSFTFFMFLVHFYPNILGHSDNFIPANPLVTPSHIVPEWYFTPFYAILRSYPDKLGGVIAMISAILVLFILPFYNLGKNDVPASLSHLHKICFWLFVSTFFILTFLGGKPASAPYVNLSMVASFAYFYYFLIITPFLAWFERNIIETIQKQLYNNRSHDISTDISLAAVPKSFTSQNRAINPPGPWVSNRFLPEHKTVLGYWAKETTTSFPRRFISFTRWKYPYYPDSRNPMVRSSVFDSKPSYWYSFYKEKSPENRWNYRHPNVTSLSRSKLVSIDSTIRVGPSLYIKYRMVPSAEGWIIYITWW